MITLADNITAVTAQMVRRRRAFSVFNSVMFSSYISV
jgi:hypothetical protein